MLPVLSREFGGRPGARRAHGRGGGARHRGRVERLRPALGRARPPAGDGRRDRAPRPRDARLRLRPDARRALRLRAAQGMLRARHDGRVGRLRRRPLRRAATSPRWSAAIIGASVVGGLLGRVVAGAIAAHAGWRAPFVVFAALTAARRPAPRARARAGRRPRAGGARRRVRAGCSGTCATRGSSAPTSSAASLFFGWIGIFTYLPYHLSAPPYALRTGVVSSVYLVYAAGVVASPRRGAPLRPRRARRASSRSASRSRRRGMALTAARPLAARGRRPRRARARHVHRAGGRAGVRERDRAEREGRRERALPHELLRGRDARVRLPGLAFQAGGLGRRRRRLRRRRSRSRWPRTRCCAGGCRGGGRACRVRA